MPRITPSGALTSMASSSELAVSRRSGARKASAFSAEYSKISAVSCTSPNLSAYSLPISSVSSRANTSGDSVRIAAARRHTAARSANEVWRHDSNVLCACPRSCVTCWSVRSSNVATTWLSYGFTVWYAMVLLPFCSRRLLAAAFEWCWRAVALVTPLVLSLPISPSNGSPQMLPSRSGKNRYLVGSGSPCRWRRRTESIAGQQFREAGRSGDKQLHQWSGAFALLVKCASAKHPHVGDSTAGNCAAPRIPPTSEQALTCSAVDRKKEPAE